MRQQYAQGDSGGRDLHVVSDWLANRMIKLGYVQRLDRSQLPNVNRNLIDRLRTPVLDSAKDYSVPWQSGMTGLIYRKDKVKREPKSINDLFDPDYKGRVTMLTELYDTVPMTMLAQGRNPREATLDDMLAAIEKVEREAASGQVRAFTGNEYTKDITKGDSWLILGWSGDAIQLQADNPNIEFVQPEEGFLLWSDNMQVPVGAPHAFTAQKFMDFVYRPEVQADITAWVNYVCPVKGVRELLEKSDPELAESELIFPSRREPDRVHRPAAARGQGGAGGRERVPAGHRRLMLETVSLADAEVVALTTASIAEIDARYGGEPGSGGPPRPEEFAAPAGTFLLARVDGRPAGCGGLCRQDAETAEVRRMYVVPEARGRGIGRVLLTGLVEAAGELGYRRVRLETGDKQHEAMGLYRAEGFRPDPLLGAVRGRPQERLPGAGAGAGIGHRAAHAVSTARRTAAPWLHPPKARCVGPLRRAFRPWTRRASARGPCVSARAAPAARAPRRARTAPGSAHRRRRRASVPGR